VGAAVGEDPVGVVQEPVSGGWWWSGPRDKRVAAGRSDVAGDGDGAAFVGGLDGAVDRGGGGGVFAGGLGRWCP